MFRRLPILVGLIALILGPWSANEAWAQDQSQIDFASTVALSLAQPIRLADAEQRPAQQIRIVQPYRDTRSSVALKSLYASTVVMQGLDVHSTMSLLNRGGGEGNPLMAGVVKNKAAFLGVKAAVATGTILAARQIAKRNKVAAFATLVAINSAYGLVVQHNYRVARSLR